jgi:hypothetical protein
MRRLGSFDLSKEDNIEYVFLKIKEMYLTGSE